MPGRLLVLLALVAVPQVLAGQALLLREAVEAIVQGQGYFLGGLHEAGNALLEGVDVGQQLVLLLALDLHLPEGLGLDHALPDYCLHVASLVGASVSSVDSLADDRLLGCGVGLLGQLQDPREAAPLVLKE